MRVLVVPKLSKAVIFTVLAAFACGAVLGVTFSAMPAIPVYGTAAAVQQRPGDPDVLFRVMYDPGLWRRWQIANNASRPPIPRIIHQVWIGPLARAHCDFMDTFRVDFLREHPEWQYKLWDKESFELRHGPMILGDIFAAEPNFASKADILRYELMLREGGVYIDADSIWLGNPLENLLQSARNHGFFAVAHGRLNHTVRQGDLLLNGVFGASKCHPATEALVQNLLASWADLRLRQKAPNFQATGPWFFSAVLRNLPVALIQRDVFAPGSWFDPNMLGYAARLKMVREDYPDAITFQVGASTNGHKTSQQSCDMWAQHVKRGHTYGNTATTVFERSIECPAAKSNELVSRLVWSSDFEDPQ